MRGKDLIFLMQDLANDAINLGITDEDEIVAYVKREMTPVDEMYLRRYINNEEPDD